ncbi:MAG: hypothetical protein GY795_19035 [Desulfobacterales bacterium]|nr:hypothetical protein [Desulfobacterales bacterium]
MFQTHAKKLNDEKLKFRDFKGSNGWLWRFMKRHGLGR